MHLKPSYKLFDVAIRDGELRPMSGFEGACLPYDMVAHLWKSCEADWISFRNMFPYLWQRVEGPDG